MSTYQYIAPFFSAFFGAAAAFAFALLKERSTQKNERLSRINLAVYGLIMTMEHLINLKKQFLSAHKSEFAAAQQILAKMVCPDSVHVAAIDSHVQNALAPALAKDPTLNGVFKKWPQCDFPLVPNPAKLDFTAAKKADLVRLLLLVGNQTTQVKLRINERNALWQKNEPILLSEAKSGIPTFDGMIARYEMLDIWTTIAAHVDIALAVIVEALEQLISYREGDFTKQGKVHEYFFGKQAWIMYKLPNGHEELIPPREQFVDIIGVADASNDTSLTPSENTPIRRIRSVLYSISA